MKGKKMKVDKCNRCGIDLLQDVNWHNSARKRRWLICKKCANDRQNEYNSRNPDKVHKRNNEKKYGVSYEEYCDMLEKQDHCCAICGGVETHRRKKNLSVDHCHTTGKVRGLLCSECNTGLGKFKDSLDLLEKAKEYLQNAV